MAPKDGCTGFTRRLAHECRAHPTMPCRPRFIGVVMRSARPPDRAPGSKVCDESWTDLRCVLAAPTRGRVAHDVFGVDRGRHVLRTPERPIGLDGDAPG